jgi:hypothetical protein
VLGYKREKFCRETRIFSDQPCKVSENAFVFRVRLAPHGEWSVRFNIVYIALPVKQDEKEIAEGRSREQPDAKHEESVRSWIASAPRLQCSWGSLERTYSQSLVDLAALRFKNPFASGALPRGGVAVVHGHLRAG